MKKEIELVYKGLILSTPFKKLKVSNKVGRTGKARYCYSVWLRHLIHACRNRSMPLPRHIAELGPGTSMGAGLAGLLSGAETYHAFDYAPTADPELNLRILDELAELFLNREPVPNEEEFPRIKPVLDDHSFPSDILTDEILERSLNPKRLELLRQAVHTNTGAVGYLAPWNTVDVLKPESLDMVFSQAVLEHVSDLDRTYDLLHSWLKPGGYMSHQIDFKCHNTSKLHWNGHWRYPEWAWKLVLKTRPYPLNREPASTHFRLQEAAGFQIDLVKKVELESKLTKSQLPRKYKKITDEDMTCSSAYVLSVKTG